MIPRLSLWFLIVLTVPTALCGQRPGAEDLEQLSAVKADALMPEWLQHGDPQQRAWAAFWTARDGQAQQIPQLLDQLAIYEASPRATSRDWAEEEMAILTGLDALIQLKAEVPPDLAEALYPKFPVPALALIARSQAEARDALLRMLDGTQASSLLNWLAVADLLAANPPPGFAVRLLKNISIQASVQVLSPGQGAPGSGMAGDCAGSTEGAPQRDWPPVGAYRLATGPSPGSRLLTSGENPVYVVRTLTRDYFFADHVSGDCAELTMVTRADLSRDLIGQLLGVKKDAFALQLNPVLNVTWTLPRLYVQQVSAFVLQQQKILQDTETGLESRELLTEAEAASALPLIDLEIMDFRTSKAPLPDLALTDSAIRITYVAADPVD